ncbi:MAG: biotin/lipoyl-binding protein [Chloroflexi bacterium]|nr:biotin/lipoyl-binding protein [Chloroflexota bacterium]MCC6897132.1 biotin/lipoyl-binding protein [Anaerolineae bacterium]
MKYVTTVNNKQFEIEILADGSITVDGQKREVDFHALGPSMYSILAENVSHELTIEQRDDEIEVLMRGRLYSTRVLDERALLMAQRSGGLGGDSGEVNIKSPMPGLIVAVKVEAGQAVKAGDTVVILESMKMQNELKASRDGVVGSVNVQAGQTVEQHKVLVSIS